MLKFIYSTLMTLLLPLIFLRLLVRSRKDASYRQNWSERLGLNSVNINKPIIWVHAVSLGETVAITPLVEALIKDFPEYQVLLTNMTITGAAKTKQQFGGRILQQFIPYDIPFIIKPFIRKVNPRLVIISETELWPNMLQSLGKNNVPVLIANARLNSTSASRYKLAGSMARNMFDAVSVLAVQSSLDAEQFQLVGVSENKLVQTGNLKFEQSVPKNQKLQGEQWRTDINRLTWIAASTHEAEERVIMAAHQELLNSFPDLLLILVPRHPGRFNMVAYNLSSEKLKFKRHSEQQLPTVEDQVWLGDTMGNLFAYYAASDLAFVGGSIAKIGGHSPMEPAAIGLPVMMGPEVFKCQQAHDELVDYGSLIPVTSETLLSETRKLLADENKRQTMSMAARKWVAASQGATENHLKLVRQLLTRKKKL